MNTVQDQVGYKTEWKITRYADQEAFEAGLPSEVVGGDGTLLPAETVVEGNLLLTEGITRIWNLVIGAGGTVYSNANARIGVGDGAPTALAGTLAFTNGSTTVTGTGTSFTTALAAGDHIIGPDNLLYTVQSIGSNTALTLTANYAGGTVSGQTVNKLLRAIDTQTDLQASTNKLYKGMDATFPQVSGKSLILQAQFGVGEANFAWNEFTADNGSSPSENLNRKVAVSGSKAGGVWTLQMTITLG